MMREPDSLNHHNHLNHHHHHDEQNAHDGFPPELDPLAARLTADGAAWQNRLPDAAQVAARIRAIPDGAPPAVSVDDVTLPMGISSPADSGAGWDTSRTQPRRRASSSGWGRFLGLAAAVVVVALIATVLAQVAGHSNSLNTGPGKITVPTHAQSQPTVVPTIPATTATATGYPVLVYFSKDPDSYTDPTAVFPVHRTSPTLGVATYAIQQLFLGPTPSEAADGYFTELSTVLQRGGMSSCGGSDFKLTLNMRGTTPETGTATLQFCRQTASPGIGADARVKAEIEKTLTQFSNITKVVILLQNGHCFGDMSGADLCLQ
jgi:hypothetical protein